jgi:4-hydroxy-tetrahydrodipicolinate reductase
MSDMRLVVAGAGGRMGQAVIRNALKMPGVKLVAGLEAADNPKLGADLGALVGAEPVGAFLTGDALPAIAAADAVIDFTNPAASLDLADLAAQARIVHVIGTTGFDEAAGKRLAAAARHATIVKSGNFSLGVNLLAGLVELAAQKLGPEFDIEILEMHHAQKRDAPSGTALLLGEAAAAGRNAKLGDVRSKPHDGIAGPRPRGTIGFASLRAGTVVGEHTVIMAGEGESITLGHRAEDRAIFARGALRAALWGQGKGPGLFSMKDVLGLDRL